MKIFFTGFSPANSELLLIWNLVRNLSPHKEEEPLNFVDDTRTLLKGHTCIRYGH